MLRPGLADSSVPATLQGKVAANLNAAQAGSLAAQPGIISRMTPRPHWADNLNYVTVGRCRTMPVSTQPTECRMKSAVKTKARKTNNQASFGGSLLRNDMDVEASMELARHLDETGLHHVYTVCTCHSI